MTVLTATSLDQLTTLVSGAAPKRAATKAIAEARFIEAFTARVGEELVAASRRDILDAGSIEVARAMVEAAIRQSDDNLLAAIEAPVEVAPILPAPRFAGPGLARLRAHPDAAKMRDEVVANNEAARRGDDPFKPGSKLFRKAALELVEAVAPVASEKPKKERAPKARKAETAPRAKAAPEGKIVAVQANPKKAGSKAHACFSIYQAGQTVAEFIAACAVAGIGEAEAKANLSWDRRKGFITVE